MRLVTLNTWKGEGAYAKRLDAMAAGLASLAPDVVTLQEALAAPEAGYDTAGHLATSLGMAAASHALRRKARMVEGRMMESTSGLAVLSRFPIRWQRAVRLTSDPRDGERAVLVAGIEVKGQPVTLVCLHLTHLTEAKSLRQQQWHEVAAAVAGPAAVIVAGDFNAPIEAFDLRRSGFIDSRQACHQPATSTLIDDPSGVCIDHILFTGGRGLTASGWRTALGEPPPGSDVTSSDHLAVVVDFAVGA